MALPGWNSPSSVVEIHAALEAAALLFFAALVVFEVLAHFDKKRETLLERTALICFAVAVVAEICAYPYSRRNDTLAAEARTVSEGNIAALNKEAGDARQKAGEAEEAAGKANERAAEANRIAEGEGLARVKMEKQLAPRTLTQSDRETLGKQLRPFASRFSGRKVRISSYSCDAEGIVFSLEIVDVLIRAGIDVDPIIGRNFPVGLVNLGVKVTGPTEDAVFIGSLLTGIRTHVDTDHLRGEAGPKYSEVSVEVGVKPIAGLPTVIPAEAPR